MQAVRPSAPILPLTSIRFLAAFYVVVHHSNLWLWHLDGSTFQGRLLQNGYVSVSFFFVLSGFILAFVYLDTPRPFSRRAFWVARFSRIYPLLFASLLFDVPNLLLALAAHTGWRTALKTTAFSLVSGALLLQAWAGRFRQLNTPSWSLSAEAFFYFAFPFLAFPLWRKRNWSALLTLLLLWLAALTIPALVTLQSPSLAVAHSESRLQVTVELLPLFRIFEFLAGIVLFSLHRSFSERYSRSIRNRLGLLFLLTSLALFLTAVAESNRIPVMIMNTGALLPAFCLLILGLASIDGFLASWLSHPVPVLLGEASYAVYLLHAPLWTYLSRIFAIDTPARWTFFVALLLALSIASFLFLERPARKAILRLAAVRPPVTLDQESAAAHPALLR